MSEPFPSGDSHDRKLRTAAPAVHAAAFWRVIPSAMVARKEEMQRM